MGNSCIRLSELLKTEKEIIKRHIDEFKWYRQIPDINEGIISFIKEYGWIIREMYCSHICTEKDNCTTYLEMLKNHNKEK